MNDRDWQVPDADAAEQAADTEADENDDVEEPIDEEAPLADDAPEADALEQRRVVDEDEDEYRES